MTFLKTLGLLIPLLFCANSWADNVKINPDHPNQYTVVKGDTLWDISGKFLENPWQWPQLWENNQQIENPDLIYPGDTLYFLVIDGKPQLSFAKNKILKARIRSTQTEQAIKMIPTDAIAQFLTSPKVVDEHELAQSPYVIEFAGEHIIAGLGDRVYVQSIENPASLSYTIYRQGITYISPETNKVLGYEAKYIADTTIERAGSPATLTITKADNEVRIGDRLMVSAEGELALNYFPRPPSENITGSIISVLDGISQIGQHDIVVLDKGSDDGLAAGHILDIYQRGRTVRDPFAKDKNAAVTLPDEVAGLLMVFRTFKHVSYALVLEATQAIHVFDRVETP